MLCVAWVLGLGAHTLDYLAVRVLVALGVVWVVQVGHVCSPWNSVDGIACSPWSLIDDSGFAFEFEVVWHLIDRKGVDNWVVEVWNAVVGGMVVCGVEA